MTINVEFDDAKQANRILYLIHRDLARVRGNFVMAQEKIEYDQNRDPNEKSLPGRIRQSAYQTIEQTPEQQAVLEGAQEAIKAGLAEARKRGEIG